MSARASSALRRWASLRSDMTDQILSTHVRKCSPPTPRTDGWVVNAAVYKVKVVLVVRGNYYAERRRRQRYKKDLGDFDGVLERGLCTDSSADVEHVRRFYCCVTAAAASPLSSVRRSLKHSAALCQ